MIGDTLINVGYLVASALFIIGLKMLSRQQTARRGNMISAVGMLLAVIMALLNSGLDYRYIIIGLLIGAVVGAVAALRVALTSMPEMVALFNGFGGLASLLVGWAEYEKARALWTQEPVSASLMMLIGTALAVLIGGVTFTGSMVAWAKLARSFPAARSSSRASRCSTCWSRCARWALPWPS